MQPQSPAAAVQAAVDVIGPAAEAAGVAVVVELQDCDPVLGDVSRLQQIVWNLLANAVKFTPHGGEIRVQLRCTATHAQVSVSDTGVGIAPEALPHIFERFRQGDGSITRRFGGLGLGLSIVRHLAELHGGTVRAESEGEGRGARFILELPLHASQGATPSSPVARGAMAPANLAGIEVVVVDDEHDSLDLLQRVLEESGAVVHAASSADQALALVRQLRPPVLLSDIGMPGTDGYELLRRVRKLQQEAPWPLEAIALTAFARPEDRQRALAAGFARHLTKPMNPAEVVAAVAEAHAVASDAR
jgi:CheY-like chemotaxis protein/anti-sigma regulatory factor (Ser/Thr protein kinase)